MFGFSFKDRVKKILKNHFEYEASGSIGVALDQVCNHAKQTGSNEASAAMMTMMVAMNSLEPSGDLETDRRVSEFVELQSTRVLQLIPQSQQEPSDVIEMLSQIRNKHGLSSAGEEDNTLKKIMEVMADFVGLKAMDLMLSNSIDSSGLTEFQKQYVSFLQVWGSIDFLMQQFGSDDQATFFAAITSICDGDLYNWESSQLESVISLAGAHQEEVWAQEIIRSGGVSLQDILKGDGDGMSLGNVLQNKGMVKKIALRVPGNISDV